MKERPPELAVCPTCGRPWIGGDTWSQLMSEAARKDDLYGDVVDRILAFDLGCTTRAIGVGCKLLDK